MLPKNQKQLAYVSLKQADSFWNGYLLMFG